MLNVAMDMMVEATDPKKQSELVQELTGPFRMIGTSKDHDALVAPAWWHGDEEAFESAQLVSLPRRRR